MSAGSTLASLLTAVKANAAAVAVAGAVVVGGGAAAVAVTTGAVHLPGQRTEATHTPDATAGAAARLQACANNGDASRLADVYAPMFGGSKATATTDICKLFAGTTHAYGFGEVQQMLDIAATIEHNGGSAACLSTPLATATPGKPGDAGQPSFTAPSSDESTTMGLIDTIMKDNANGTSLAHLASNCSVPHRPGSAGTGSGTPDGQPEGTPGGKPTGTPGAKPTGTPGHP